jgi:DNA-binding MarR family transcriptional regulator
MILTAIYFEEGESYPKRLADTLNTSPSNLSHSIKYLCSKGLLQKFMCEEDTRRTILKLTSKGSKKVSKLIYLYNQTQALFEDAISEKSIMSWNKKSSELIEAFQNQ